MVAIARCLVLGAVLALTGDIERTEAAGSNLVTELSYTTFDQEVLDEKGAILVMFHVPGENELSSALEEAAKLIQQNTRKMRFTPRIATLDVTRARMIALRYDLTKYPTLLLFAEQGTIDGEEYARSKKPKSISDYLIALATRPEVLEGKKQRHQLEKAALETTVQLKRDGIDRFFDAFWKENNFTDTESSSVLMYFHSKFCDECKELLKEFAVASKMLESEGFPHGAMAHLQGTPAQPGGDSRAILGEELAIEEYPQACEDCKPCADKLAPCFWLVDVTGTDTNVSVVDSGVDVQGVRKHQVMYEVFRSHHLQMGRELPLGRSTAELERLAANRKDEF